MPPARGTEPAYFSAGLGTAAQHVRSRPSREQTMPIFSYFAVMGSVLVALLFAADATLERSPLRSTSEFAGLPKAWHAADWQPETKTPVLVATPAPAPDMKSEAVVAAAPPPIAKGQAALPCQDGSRSRSGGEARRRAQEAEAHASAGRRTPPTTGRTMPGAAAATMEASSAAACSGASESDQTARPEPARMGVAKPRSHPFTPSNSTSNISVAFGGIAPPAPRAP